MSNQPTPLKAYRDRFLKALWQRRNRRRTSAVTAAEALETRALLSAVAYDAATLTVDFVADAGDENFVTVASPDANTLVILSQRRVGGSLVNDPITLQGDAVGNPDFVLQSSGTQLTIDISAGGSLVTQLNVDTVDEADDIRVQSTPQFTRTALQAGVDDDSITIGSGFVMDGVLGDVSVDGDSGDDALMLLDFNSSGADIVTLTDAKVTGLSSGDISYAGIEDLQIDTADLQPVTFNVLSTAAGTNTDLDLTSKDANDNPIRATLTLGNSASLFGAFGNMDAILGDVKVTADGGSILLQIDDGGDTTGDTAIISMSEVSGFSAGTTDFEPGTIFDGMTAFAGSDSDSVDASGASKNLLVLGGDGADVIIGSPHADVLVGEGGADLIIAGGGDDQIESGDGDDTVHGGDGADLIQAGPGDDSIRGDAGNDLLFGDMGDDTLAGNRGGDLLSGGFGDDVLRGGPGRDSMLWNRGDGSDVVDGGSPSGTSTTGTDRMVISGTGVDEGYVIGMAGSATVVTIGTETVTMTAGVEILELNASGGDDTVLVNDLTGTSLQGISIHGGDGNDFLDGTNATGGPGLELIGGRGNDVLHGSPSDDGLKGGSGSDSLAGNAGADVIRGSSGADSVVWNSGDGDDVVDGGAGEDKQTFRATAASDSYVLFQQSSGFATFADIRSPMSVSLNDIDTLTVDTFGGDDSVRVLDLSATTITHINADMGDGDDTFDGSGLTTPVDLNLLAGRGKDQLTGGPGDDFLRGASGKDTLKGGGGQDQLIGDEGDDSLSGGAGNDILNGGAGADILRGKDGNDWLSGGGDDDRLFGDDGDDTLLGDSGKDMLFAGAGNDLLSAGQGADLLDAGEGKDFLIGGDGADVLRGRGGQDLMVAGRVGLSTSDLESIHSEWLSDRDYEDRTDNIVDGSGAGVGQNGSAFLLAITQGRTVHDDAAADELEGGAGRDLFFADFDTDLIPGRVPTETQIDLR